MNMKRWVKMPLDTVLSWPRGACGDCGTVTWKHNGCHSYQMVAQNHKLAHNHKLAPVCISGRCLPCWPSSWISGKGQLVLLDKWHETLIAWGMRFYTIETPKDRNRLSSMGDSNLKMVRTSGTREGSCNIKRGRAFLRNWLETPITASLEASFLRWSCPCAIWQGWLWGITASSWLTGIGSKDWVFLLSGSCEFCSLSSPTDFHKPCTNLLVWLLLKFNL